MEPTPLNMSRIPKDEKVSQFFSAAGLHGGCYEHWTGNVVQLAT